MDDQFDITVDDGSDPDAPIPYFLTDESTLADAYGVSSDSYRPREERSEDRTP